MVNKSHEKSKTNHSWVYFLILSNPPHPPMLLRPGPIQSSWGCESLKTDHKYTVLFTAETTGQFIHPNRNKSAISVNKNTKIHSRQSFFSIFWILYSKQDRLIELKKTKTGRLVDDKSTWCSLHFIFIKRFSNFINQPGVFSKCCSKWGEL